MTARFETFTVLINRISRNIRKIKNQEMAEYGLRSAHVSCLYYLYCSNGLTSTDLCERCEEDKATISRAIEYLEQNDYITCQSKSAKRYKRCEAHCREECANQRWYHVFYVLCPQGQGTFIFWRNKHETL